MSDQKPIPTFTYEEHRTTQAGRQTVHRIWVGEYADPANTIGIIVGSGDQRGYGSYDIAIPLSAVPHLIRYLQQFEDGGDQ